MKTLLYDVTPSSTSGLAANDVIFTATSIGNDGSGYLESVWCYNLDDIDRGIDLYFMDSSFSVGAANAAFNMSDANAIKTLAKITFSSGSWLDATNSLLQVKGPSDTGMNVWLEASDPGTSSLIYIVGVAKSTGGWSSGGLKFKIGLRPA